MAKSTIVKCKHCGKEVEKDKAYNPSPRQYYCSKEHFDERERKRLGENDRNGKIKYKPQKDTSRRQFTDYTQSIYVDRYGWDKKKINWVLICSHASNLLKEYEKWSYDTLTYILYYMNEVLELDLICKESNYNPLSLIPFYAQEAEDYYNECARIEETIENFDLDSKPTIIKKNSTKNNRYKTIDISSL